MRRSCSGFTLIELLVTISIIAMLLALLSPTLGRAGKEAQKLKCANNLRTIGTAALQYANDNEGRFPVIEGMPSEPIYPPDAKAGKLIDVLGPYGVTDATLRCSADIARDNYYKKEGSSYMWRPLVDGDPTSAPKIFTRRGQIVPALSRVVLASDFEAVHDGHSNCVFADGHIRTF